MIATSPPELPALAAGPRSPVAGSVPIVAGMRSRRRDACPATTGRAREEELEKIPEISRNVRRVA